MCTTAALSFVLCSIYLPYLLFAVLLVASYQFLLSLYSRYFDISSLCSLAFYSSLSLKKKSCQHIVSRCFLLAVLTTLSSLYLVSSLFSRCSRCIFVTVLVTFFVAIHSRCCFHCLLSHHCSCLLSLRCFSLFSFNDCKVC